MGLFGGGNGDDVEIKIELTGAEEATQKAEKLTKSVEDLGKTAERSGSGFTDLQAKIITANEAIELGQKVATALIGTLKFTAGAVIELAEAGDKLGDLEEGFAALGGSSKAIELASGRINDILPNIDLLRLANKAMVAGIPEVNKNFGDIAEYGRKVADSLGVDATQGIEQLTQALVSGRSVALKQLGIMVDSDKANQDYAKSMGIVGRELSELEKKSAVTAQALEQMRQNLGKMPETGDSVQDALDAIKAKFTNLIGETGKAINENDDLTIALRTLANTIGKIDVKELANDVAFLTSKFVDGVTAVLKWADSLRKAWKEAEARNKGIEETAKSTEKETRARLELELVMEEERQAYKQELKLLKEESDARDKANKQLEAGKKASEELRKEKERMIETEKKAFQSLQTDIRQLVEQNNLDKLQDDLKKAFEFKDLNAVGSLKENIRAQVYDGIVKGYVEAGGKITSETEPFLKQKADLETEEIVKNTKDGIEKGVKDGFLQSELPNYLSEMITNSITTGFTEGFSNETLKSAGNSLSSIFAQEFQNSFQKIFSDEAGGGFAANWQGALTNLGISYGISTLTANASDNEKDVKGGVASGAILGASYGASFGPWGALIGAGVGAAGGYFVGASGPSTNSDTKQRHETINFIEGLIDNKHLSFLQEQGNIIEGFNYRFNSQIDNPWWRGAANSIQQGAMNLPGISMDQAITGGNGPISGPVNFDNQYVTPAIIGQTQYGGPTSGVGSIGGPGWADQYWQQFGQVAGESFQGLGAAFSEMAGQMGPAMEQVGVIIAENLGGNLDNARMLLQTLGVGAEGLEQSFMNIGLAGEESWHTVETWMQRIPELTGEGLIGIGDLEGAMNQFINSGGRGQEALISLRNIGVEAMESGATSMDDLRNHLIATGKFTKEQIDALMGGLAQRGITSLDDLKNASDRTLGGVTADAESLGFAWSDSIGQGLADSIDDVEKLKSVISDLPDTIEKNITLKVKTEYSGDDAKALYTDLRNNVGVARA